MLWGAELLGLGQGLPPSITVSLEIAVMGAPGPQTSSLPAASSTVKPKATNVNKCGLSQRTNEKIKGYDNASLEEGQGRVSTVEHSPVQTCGDFQQQQ